MKKGLAIIICLFGFVGTASAQETAKPDYWKKWMDTSLSFKQTSLTDWAAGGNSSATFGTTLDANANYAKGRITFNNRLRAAYGFTQTFGVGFQKSADYLIIDNLLGYKIKGKYSATLNYSMDTQMTPGYSSTYGTGDIVSRFFSPAKMSLGAGATFTHKGLEVTLTPLTGQVRFVKDPTLRPRYGNAEDEFAHWELGARLALKAGASVQGLNINTTFSAFSNYLNKPLNMPVDWTLAISAPLTKFLSFTLNCRAIYDDRVRFKTHQNPDGSNVCDEAGNTLLFPALQFQEIAGLTFSYKFQ
ncbi:MAG: DUF3078 domain-containing protein [Bacteroidales bacterium]|nr:DUF3078 domain-containing protein [Candidatus Equibacterium intestinale]